LGYCFVDDLQKRKLTIISFGKEAFIFGPDQLQGHF